MEKLYIIGAGGMGTEVQWLVERINEGQLTWELVGYLDDNLERGAMINGLPIVGGVNYLKSISEPLAIVCAIANPDTKKKVIQLISQNPYVLFPTLIDPEAIVSKRAKIGKGCVISMNAIIGSQTQLGNFVLVNTNSDVAHHTYIGDYSTLFNRIEIGGHVEVGEQVVVGTGSVVLPGKKITNQAIVGAASLIVKDITEAGTYVGVPGKRIK